MIWHSKTRGDPQASQGGTTLGSYVLFVVISPAVDVGDRSEREVPVPVTGICVPGAGARVWANGNNRLYVLSVENGSGIPESSYLWK